MPSVIVWDLETVPDLGGFAAANDLVGKSDVEVREAIGDKFPKHIYHSIVCIGALIAHCFVISALRQIVQADQDIDLAGTKGASERADAIPQTCLVDGPTLTRALGILARRRRSQICD
jgi:hypothetical protein